MMKKFTFIAVFCMLCAFVSNAGSGIYIRGGLNNWGAEADWEFVDEGEGVYTLENKVLFGAFKVADLNYATFNYGASADALVVGTPYALVNGSNNNLDLGDKTYDCSKITLTINSSDNSATLLIVGTEQEAAEITTVYVMGNNNGWDFTDASGALAKDEADGLFKGDVTFETAGDNAGLAYWRIYEGLGQKGSWGLETNATENTLSGTFVKGKEGCATTELGTYTITFDLATGNFSLVKKEEGAVAEVSADGIRVSAVNGEINVYGAASVRVYTMGGALVSESASARVNPGLYIVKADNKVAKVVVR